MQHYIAQATLAYQKEIVRLRGVVDGVVDGRPGQQARQQVQQPRAKDSGQLPWQQQHQLTRSSSSNDGSTKAAASVRQQLRPLVRSASNRSPLNANPVIDAWQKS